MATESAQPRSPSAIAPGERFIVRVYVEGAHDPEIYQHVKHVWISCGVLTILHYWSSEMYRYACWPLDRVRWYQVMPQRFEGGDNA